MSVIEDTPSDKIAQAFPEFAKITVFGTSEDPLFPVSQVQEFLGLKSQIRLDKSGYELGEDYIQVDCARKDGRPNLQNMLTEDGLYRVLFKSDGDVCKKFRRFTKIVMRELRLRGQVTVDGAIAKLHQLEAEKADLVLQLEKKTELIAILDKQLEDTHGNMVKFKKESERFYTRSMASAERAAISEMRMREFENRQSENQEYTTVRLKEMFMKPLFVYLAKPPKALIDDFPDFEDVGPTDDDEICFEVSTTDRGNSIADGLYVHKGVTMKQLAEKLHARNFTLMVGEKMHQTKYMGSIDNLRDLVNSML